MKRFAILGALVMAFAIFSPSAFAQDDLNHGNFGVYFDYTRLDNADLNMFGVGARLGVNVHPHVVLEGEMAWDFERSFSTTITGATGSTIVRSNLRLLHGLFGPKIQTTGPVRVFAVLKGGFVNFGRGGAATAGTLGNQISNVADGDTDGAFYPGGGVEFNVGWLGFRVDAGDEIIWFNDGAHNNFRLTAGPQIRF